jgi:hypothetical protein
VGVREVAHRQPMSECERSEAHRRRPRLPTPNESDGSGSIW